MCGIYGIWHRDGAPVDLLAVQRAVTAIQHRGPDDEGYLLVETRSGRAAPCGGAQTDPAIDLPRIEQFVGQPFDLVLGFRRLAILDLSPAGHQPMSSLDGRFWLVYNGELYNYLDLRSELAGCGYSFRSSSDSEVILAAYQEWGADCLRRFNGMFAFAIWDARQHALYLARDHFGIKPLCLAETGRTFRFASEHKALVGAHGVPFVPEDRAVYAYLAWGVLPASQEGETFYRDIRTLPPGHSLTLTAGGAAQRRYWDVIPEPSASVSAEQAVQGYAELFADAVRLQLQADVPVGTCLSGGVDSSAIVGAVNRLVRHAATPVGERQKTFSAVYHTDAPFNERAFIDQMVAHTGVQEHFTFPTVEGLSADLDRLIWHQDEPFQSTSIYAQWCVIRLVRESGVIVLLDGQGADETMAGYPQFWTVHLAEMARREGLGAALSEARAMRSVAGQSLPAMLRTISLAFLSPLPSRVRAGLISRARVMLRQDERLDELNPDFRAHAAGSAVRPAAANYDTLNDYAYDAVFDLSLPHLLRYEDRNSMAFSIEARVPYLDHRLVSYAFGAAAPWRMHRGWTKWVLRQAVSDLLPPQIAWRRDKVAFATPESEWLHQLGRARRDGFTPESPAALYLKVDAVRRALAQPSASTAEARRRWRWINLEGWLRQGQSNA